MSPADGAASSDAPDQSSSTDAILRALADPQRRQILRLVQAGELAAGEIAAHFDATQQAVSHHLQVLAKAGLVHDRRSGTRRLYALDLDGLDPIREMLAELWPSSLERLKAVVEHDQRKLAGGDGQARSS